VSYSLGQTRRGQNGTREGRSEVRLLSCQFGIVILHPGLAPPASRQLNRHDEARHSTKGTSDLNLGGIDNDQPGVVSVREHGSSPSQPITCAREEKMEVGEAQAWGPRDGLGLCRGGQGEQEGAEKIMACYESIHRIRLGYAPSF